jgi:hypothetical protein
MSSSSYYWARHLIQGLGKLWFLIVPQEADSPGGGASLLGSVVNEIGGSLFPSTGSIIGKDYPEPYHLTTPRLILKTLEEHRQSLGIGSNELLMQEINYAGLRINVEKRRVLKSGVGGFPSLPASLSVDYSRIVSISIEFGKNTRQQYIPVGYLSRLKTFYRGDATKIPGSEGVNIDKETIIHQILLTKEYSVTFESTASFDANFEAALNQSSALSGGRITASFGNQTKKQVTVNVKGDRDYLIALKDIDWDDF